MGLRYAPTGNEAVSPGDTQESWGIADVASGTHGNADESDFYFIGKANATATDFSATERTANSVVSVVANGTMSSGPAFQVTHEFRPSPVTENIYEVLVTVKNTSVNAAEDVRYRRVVDWDTEPTAFSELVTVNEGTAPQILFASNDGFADPNPLGGRTDSGEVGSFVDSGPYDQGATFDLGFGELPAGQQKTFKLFYGAAGNEAQAVGALEQVGADAYSLGQPVARGTSEPGAPNTFVLGFLVTPRPPTAADDAASTEEDEPVTFDVLANDSDRNSDALTVGGFAQPENGQVDCTNQGECTYTPDEDFSGADSFTYTATDGNEESKTATVAIDVGATNDPPRASDDVTSTTGTRPVTVGVLGNDTDADGDSLALNGYTQAANGSVNCTPDGQCTYTADSGFSGEDTFTYTATDGNGGEDNANVTIGVAPPDTTPPETSIVSGPDGPTNDATPTFSFGGSDIVTAEANLLFSYRVDEEAWSEYSSATSATVGGQTGLPDGEHAFSVRAKDEAGNVDDTPPRHTWTVDTAAPLADVVTPVNGATGVSPEANAEVRFSEAMDTGSLNSATFTLVKQGSTGQVAAAVSYDATAKKAVLNPAANLDPGATYGATVKSGAGGAKDLAGNSIAADRVWAFTVLSPDTIPPDTTIDSGPTGPVGSASATFAFSSTEPGSTFECSLDGAAFGGCASPKTYSALPDGSHTFRVRAVDPADNVGAAAERGFVVDTVAPGVPSIDLDATSDSGTSSTDNITNDNTPTLMGTSATGSTVSVYAGTRLLGKVAPNSSGNWQLTVLSSAPLANGTHAISAEAADAVGNVSAKSGTLSVKIDTMAPETTIDAAPASGGFSGPAVTFGFSSNEGNSGFQCKLDAAAYAACSSPKNFTGLGNGSHTFQVHATDLAGNADGTAASRSWSVDAVPPSVCCVSEGITTPSQLGTSTVPVKVGWTGREYESGIDHFEVQKSVNGGAYTDVGLPAPTATSVTHSLSPDAAYRFRVRAQDKGGNWSEWVSGPSFDLSVHAENGPAVTYSAGDWTRVASTTAYGGYTKHATSERAKATFTFVGNDFAWVSNVGPNRGKAEVYIDGGLVETVDLYSSTAEERRVVFNWSTSCTPRQHTVEIRLTGTKNTLSTKSRVDVDAFVISNPKVGCGLG